MEKEYLEVESYIVGRGGVLDPCVIEVESYMVGTVLTLAVVARTSSKSKQHTVVSSSNKH